MCQPQGTAVIPDPALLFRATLVFAENLPWEYGRAARAPRKQRYLFQVALFEFKTSTRRMDAGTHSIHTLFGCYHKQNLQSAHKVCNWYENGFFKSVCHARVAVLRTYP